MEKPSLSISAKLDGYDELMEPLKTLEQHLAKITDVQGKVIELNTVILDKNVDIKSLAESIAESIAKSIKTSISV